MLMITLTSGSFVASFEICEIDANVWVAYAQRHRFGITLEAETEAYQQYRRDFPKHDPRD